MNNERTRKSMNLVLNQNELQGLFRPIAGTGGFQSLLTKLQSQCNQATGAIDLDADDLRRIPVYAFDAGQGGFQSRLVSIFSRTLGAHLGR